MTEMKTLTISGKTYEVVDETARTTKQDALMSGENIKTINGQSLLGSGDITIEVNNETVDLSSYATKEELNSKQDTLVSGTNIKTINGQSLLGTGDITTAGEEPIKLLFVGNSFSQNATKYIHNILNNLGYSGYTVGIAYIGGCSLETHLTNLKSNATSYSYQKNTGSGFTGTTQSLRSILTAEQWSHIVFHQKSSLSDDAASYEDIYEILNYAKKYCPSARIGWQMTWENTGATYGDIVNTVKSTILKNAFFDFIIPNGTVIENAKTSFVDYAKIMNANDNLHLSEEYSFGQMAATLGTVKSVLGEKLNLDNMTWKGSLTDSEFLVLKESVVNAYNLPFQVTNSSYADEGTVPETPVNPTTYTITYQNNGHGTQPSNLSDVTAFPNPLPTLTEDGWIFEGWFTNSELTNAAVAGAGISADTTLYAKWVEEEPTYSTLNYTLRNGYYNTNMSYLPTSEPLTNMNNYVSTNIITRDMLPNGSRITVADGWCYRPNGWESETTPSVSSARPDIVGAGTVTVDDSWWFGKNGTTEFTVRIFCISRAKVDDPNNADSNTTLNATTDDALIREAFKIEIPKA